MAFSLLERMARGSVDALFARWASRRARQIDRRSAVTAQCQSLQGLVRRAAGTRFGREHGFAGVRSVRDFQERVPLRDYEAFWNEYWRPAFPTLRDVTWPGATPYLALSSGTTSGDTKYIPVTREMVASNRRAALTALAWLRAAHPDTPLFTGRMFFLGGSTALERRSPQQADGPQFGDLSGIAAREVPGLLRPFAFPSLDVALERDWDRKLSLLAERSAQLPITLISGVPSWLLALFDRLKAVTGRDRVADVWPTLRVVVHGGSSFAPYAELFRRELSPSVHFQEVYPASEGFVAAEDPRFGLLRLVPDHGVFFEFVPVEELDADRPTRHTVADVVPGFRYAVVLTTCAGLWGYVLGDTVCFERRDPPLFRFTGRTKLYLSAFGEHLIGEEVERAVAAAAAATGAAASDFHVGPVFPDSPGHAGRHRYLIEFVTPPCDAARFVRVLDETLCKLNEDYRDHRRGDLALGPPELWPVRRGGFHDWMRARGRLGGQNKVPRLDNTGSLTRELETFLTRPGALLTARPCP